MWSVFRKRRETGVDMLTAKNHKRLLDTGDVVGGLSSVTEMEEDTFEFDWIVKRFSSFKGCDEVVSDTFKGPKGPYAWQLKVCQGKLQETYVGLYLCQTGFIPSSQKKLKVRFKLSLRDGKGKLGHTKVAYCDFKNGAPKGWDNFIWYKDLTVGRCPWLAGEDTLRLHCFMVIEGEVKHHQTDPGNQPIQPNSFLEANKNKALEDFGNMMREGGDLFADVEVVTATKTFKAHKNILSARSKVFAAMFTTEMTEAKSGIVKIKDFDEDTVEGMLEFMYTGQVVNLRDVARSLLQICDKYDLPGLKAVAEVRIADSLSVDNAADTLVLADLVNASFLKYKVFKFINRHKEEVKRTDAFQRLAKSNAEVIVELFLASEL